MYVELSPVEKVLDRLEDYTERQDEFRARCPAHNGTSADSLSVKEGDDRRALLVCHSGCELREICYALGISVVDLFVHSESENGTTKKVTKKTTSEMQGDDGEEEPTLTTDDLPDGTYWEFTSPSGELLYIQRHKREYYRCVGDGLWKKGLDGTAQVLYNLPELIGGVRAGEPIFHLEGPKDLETARERLGVVATTSGGTNSWRSSYREHYIGADVAIISDNDKPGRKYATDVAQDIAAVARSVKIIDLPGLEEGGDLTDWLDAGHAKQEFFAAVEKAPSYHATDESPWPAPTPLQVALPPVDVLDPVLIPEPLRGWVFDVSERMDNAPPDFAAAATVVVSAALLGRKVSIRPKRHDDWLVIPNLWGGLVGPPASMKTPALEQVVKPIKRLAAEAGEAYEDTLKRYALDVMVTEAEKTALRKKLEATAREVAAGKKSRADLEEIRREIEEIEDPEVPQERRYMANDATSEKLAEILRHNPEGILYYRDELMGLLRSLEKPGREADRAFYLEAWNGNGSFSVDRIGRGSLHIPAVCVSILGGIQPGPLLTYVHDALEESEKADGLLQRFQVLVWPDLRGYDPVDRWPDAEAKNRAYDVFKGLTSFDAEAFGAHTDEDDEIPYVRFTQEAQGVFDTWRAEFESRFRSEAGEHPAAIESHFMKYRSLFASLALIFEVVDFIGGKSQGRAVGEDSAQRAGAWCSYLESHAMRVYHPILTAPVETAEALLDRIEAGDVVHGMKVRDLHRKGWRGLSTPDGARRAIDVLADHGWVRKVVVKAGGPGRPSEQLYLHPVLRD
ncbi:MAG TPA: DUF3987 domain-containing protein [Rubrobacteraceae bacterium]|nr:DUF3987 domain-containing protein [Rubrobacteraceae bacterium]